MSNSRGLFLELSALVIVLAFFAQLMLHSLYSRLYFIDASFGTIKQSAVMVKSRSCAPYIGA